ncbi:MULTISPECIES: hypothetical protein [unclassified Pseudomonas]|uniref:hypothetical protein n=1 Tax=Pseudomonas sp. B10(2017) TaxID=1981749 RepID=UPI000A20024A|nr:MULTISPECIES: hypothetical protein [unclassified Pseudomonas]MRF40134.1 hypothetical protein [Escherichia coli]
MAQYGIRVSNSNGVEVFGMGDFTLQKMASMILPGRPRTYGDGVRRDYILMDVPGYDPATCFVMITPRAYAGYAQPGYPDNWGYLPTYKNLGGTLIGIYTYVNYRQPTNVGSNYRDKWVEHTVECVVEAVRAI